jgi:transcription elongation factor/antiterminator RfaH
MEFWYALYTKPKKEHQVDSLLREQGIETYLPTIRRKVRRRDRPERVVYFPCYLFARIDFEVVPRSSISWMPGVRRLVSSGDQPAVVAEEIVDLLRHRLESVEQVGHGRFRPGDRVRITSGPLRDLEAVFERPLSSAERVRILLDVMGRMMPVEIDYTQIKPLERGEERGAV